MLIVGTGLLIGNTKALVAVPDAGWVLSLTLKVKLKLPLVVGIPLKSPVPEASDTPGGRDPDLTDHW